MFKLALRNILRHKGRTAMTLSAIVFGGRLPGLATRMKSVGTAEAYGVPAEWLADVGLFQP